MTTNGELMQVGLDEMWEVDLGDKQFQLTPQQVTILKQATVAGQRGLVWFKNFAISIPHIKSVNLMRRNYYRLEGNVRIPIDKETYEKNVVQLDRS